MEIIEKYGPLGLLLLALGILISKLLDKASEDLYEQIKKKRRHIAESIPYIAQCLIAALIWYWLSREPQRAITHAEMTSVFGLLVLLLMLGQGALFSDMRFTWRVMTDSARFRIEALKSASTRNANPERSEP